MKILVAEDELISRELLKKHLEKYGSCDFTVNGIETVDSFISALDSGNPYDVICLDIMMPIYDGTQALKTIRKIENKRNIDENERVKVIIVSALNDPELKVKLNEDVILAYLTKPIDFEMLVKVIEDLCHE